LSDTRFRTSSFRPEESPAGESLRVLLYSHDTFGLGHLRRCLKIADALVRSFPDLSVLLVTGSPLVHRYRLPPRVDYVKLPAVRKTGSELYEARTLRVLFDSVLEMRSGLIREAVRGFSPHVVLVDHSPAGMKGEMKPALEWLRTERPGTTTILGLRDIVDAPDTVREQWTSQGMYDLLRTHYDRILVYGSREIFDPMSAYAFPPDLCDKTHFCNYLPERAASRAPARRHVQGTKPLVVVTIGGGDGAADTVILPYLDMLESRDLSSRVDTVILGGPFMPEDLRAPLQKRCRRLAVKLQFHVTSTRRLLEQSHLVVATAGYNTATEILCFARRAILIPRMLHRQEQVMRASALAERGLVSMLHPGEVTPDRLHELVKVHLASSDEPLTRARAEGRILLNGGDRIVEFCKPIFAAHRPNRETLS